MEDALGRKIDYLRVCVTDLCNLRCQYCMPEEGITKKCREEILSLEEIYETIQTAVKLGVTKVRLTGGEPLMRKDIITLIQRIGKLRGLEDIALTTNGLLLEGYADSLKEAGLCRVNISLDTLNDEKYAYITRGGNLNRVLKGIEAAKKAGLYPIKINIVGIKGFNDDEVETFAKLTINEDIHIRFIELMPIGQTGEWAKERYISNQEIKEKLPQLIPLNNGTLSSPAQYYQLPYAKGKIGFINPISSHFCMHCNRIRVTSDGKLKPCLHSNEEIDLKEALRYKNTSIENIFMQGLYKKPTKHKMNEKAYIPITRDMYRIGG